MNLTNVCPEIEDWSLWHVFMVLSGIVSIWFDKYDDERNKIGTVFSKNSFVSESYYRQTNRDSVRPSHGHDSNISQTRPEKFAVGFPVWKL